MGSLAGLVNYSDDEDSSSSGDEQTQVAEILTKKVETKVATKSAAIQKNLHIEKSNTKNEAAPPPAPVAAAPTIATAAAAISNIIKPPLVERPSMNEHNRRLMAALAPKPIEGVENWGIPDEPDTPCDPERAERISHFLSLRASGHRLNDHLQHNKAFRNPRIYTRLVEFTEVDEFGSNFDKEDFDPSGFPKELYIDGILETQKKLAEEKVAAQQNRTSVNFVSSQPQQPQTQQLSQQQSSAMAQAMATAAKVASRIAKPPIQHHDIPEKRKNKWDDDHQDAKRR